MNANTKAFLDTIAISEIGEELLALPESDNGYRVIVGSTASKPILFDNYADHPRRLITLTIRGHVVRSTAAGRYQILSRYYDHYARRLGLPDFGHDSQDAIALQLIHECKALRDIDAGCIEEALFKCRSRWASLPGAGYMQHENELADLLDAYEMAGGALA